MKTFVLDASALMTFFEGRAGAEKMEDVLARAVERKQSLLMSVVNWGEVYYSIWRAHREKSAREKIKEIAQLPIGVVGVDMEIAELAPRTSLPRAPTTVHAEQPKTSAAAQATLPSFDAPADQPKDEPKEAFVWDEPKGIE